MDEKLDILEEKIRKKAMTLVKIYDRTEDESCDEQYWRGKIEGMKWNLDQIKKLREA